MIIINYKWIDYILLYFFVINFIKKKIGGEGVKKAREIKK